jgi:tRNA(Ile)-lysidine synthase
MHSQSGDLRRPFLSIPHEAILRALQEMGQGYRLDSTNTDPRFMRNRIRRELIPLLTLLQPHAVRVIGRTASLLRQESEYLDAETDRALEHLDVRAGPEEVSASLAAWQALHPALRRRLLRRLIRIQSGDLRDIAERHVELLETTLSSASPSELKDRLPHGLQLWVGRRRFSLRFGTLAAPRLASASFIVPGELELPGGRLTGEIQENVSAEEVERLLTVCGPFNALFDADLLGTELTVRARRPGDRMRPIGLGGSRKLQDILTDRHVPVAERDLLPVIQNDRHIVWIVGIVCDERTAVSSTSTRLARLRFTPLRP